MHWALLLALLAAAPLAAPSAAQPGSRLWVGVGAGLGSIGEGDGAHQDGADEAVVALLYASYQIGVNVLSLRAVGAGELFGDKVYDAGLLYGRATKSQGGHASFGVGLATVFGSYRSDGLVGRPTRTTFFTIGVPVEVQVFLRTDYVGIGVYGFVNLNPESHFGGLTLSLQAGRLY